MAQGYRQKYLEKLNSGEELAESELLSIILGNAYGGRDMSAVADALLARFPGISEILEADIAEITAVDGVTESVAAYLKTVDRARKLFKRGDVFISGTAECFKVAKELFRGEQNESIQLFFVDRGGKVTGNKRYTSGMPDKVEVSAGELLADISSAQAYGLYVVHNHVNSQAKPSEDDTRVTVKLLSACKICNIILFDHCIISSNGEKFSYRESGLLEKLRQN